MAKIKAELEGLLDWVKEQAELDTTNHLREMAVKDVVIDSLRKEISRLTLSTQIGQVEKEKKEYEPR